VKFSADKATLDHIKVDRIRPNPENPRLAFRQAELDDLQESIRIHGIQVPLSVYKDGQQYILIDGERRWRCASKLNLKTVPALIQPKPTELENLLLMFNIHSLREQWDTFTISKKLPTIIKLLKKELGKDPTEADISSQTGLTRGMIRRCKLLMELPSEYKDMLLDELKLPKTRQKLSEDLFIEMERALKTVGRAMPDVISDIDDVRHTIIDKYKSGLIKNLVDLRKIPKIARAERVGGDTASAKRALRKLFNDPEYPLDDAFDSVSFAYAERDIVTRIDGLIDRLGTIKDEIDDDVREKLEELVTRAQEILGDR